MIRGEFIVKTIPVVNDSGGAIEANRVLTIATGKIAKAAANSDFYIGVSLPNTIYGENGETPNGKVIDVAISGVVRVVASTDLSVGEVVYADDGGKVSNEGTLVVGVALENANQDELVCVLLK